MINFVVASENSNLVRAFAHVDEDGDVTLSVNDIDILFISKNDGKLVRYWLSYDDRKVLADLGLAIDNAKIAVEGEE